MHISSSVTSESDNVAMIDLNIHSCAGSSILEVSQIVTNSTATCVSAVATSHSDSTSSSCVLPTDIAPSAAFPPVRPVRVKFLTTNFGSTCRCFNSDVLLHSSSDLKLLKTSRANSAALANLKLL